MSGIRKGWLGVTRAEAIRILDPKTTGEALAEIEYYNGFSGKKAAVHAVSDACELAVADMLEMEKRRFVPSDDLDQENEASCFATRLKNLVKSSGITYNDLSKILGISIATLNNYLNRKASPTLAGMIRIADYFAVPLDYLTCRCSQKEAKAIEDNYPALFMTLRRAPYEAYLIGRKGEIKQVKSGESPWPYNLMDEIFGEEWSEPLDYDQIAGIETAIGELTEREQDHVLSYYRDGLTLENLGKNHVVKSGELFNIRNIGRKSAEEILEKIYRLTGKRYAITGDDMTKEDA